MVNVNVLGPPSRKIRHKRDFILLIVEEAARAVWQR